MVILAKDIMTPNLISCRRHTSLDKVIKFMEKEKIFSIVITDEHLGLLGILSEWNIARFILKFNISDENLANIAVNNVMQINVTSIDVKTQLQQVVESIIDANSECIVCTEIKPDESLASVKGIICKRDVLEVIGDIILRSEDIKRYADKIIAEDIMNIEVKKIGICYEHEDVIDVKKRMAENNIKHICVINKINDKQKLIEVISYKDLIDIKTSKTVGEIKTKREEEIPNDKILITCFKNTKLSELVETMLVCHIEVIPVIDEDNTLLGIIGRKEIFEAFLLVLEDCKKNNIDFDAFNLHTRRLTEMPKVQLLQTKMDDDTNKILIPRFAIDVIPPMQKPRKEKYKVVCCGPNEKVNDVGLRMKRDNLSHIVLTTDGTDAGALLAVISTRDLTVYRRIMATVGTNINETPIHTFGNHLSSFVFYCSKYTPFSDVVEIMIKNKIGSMIITDKEKIDIKKEIDNIKENLKSAEEHIKYEIRSIISTEKDTNKLNFFEMIGEEYARMSIESHSPNPNIANISNNLTNILKIYLSLINVELNEEIIQKFKKEIEEEMSVFISKIPEEKFSSLRNIERDIEEMICDLKRYMKDRGIITQKEQLEVIEKIMNKEKDIFITAFEGDLTKAVSNFSNNLVEKTREEAYLKNHFIITMRRKIDKVLDGIYKKRMENQNVKDAIDSLNKKLAKFINIQKEAFEDCKTIMKNTLWIIAESRKKCVNSSSISNRFSEILRIYVRNAYDSSHKRKIIEVWNKEAKNIEKIFESGLSKIIKGKIIGFISRSDVLRGIKTTLSFLHSPFIEPQLSKSDYSKIYIKAGDIVMNKTMREVKTCRRNDKTIRIDRKMCGWHIGHICVVDNKDEENELIGFASYDDFIPTIRYPVSVLSSSFVGEVMSKKAELFVCDENTPLEILIDMMIENRIGGILVVEIKNNICTCTHNGNVFNDLMNSILQKKENNLFYACYSN